MGREGGGMFGFILGGEKVGFLCSRVSIGDEDCLGDRFDFGGF